LTNALAQVYYAVDSTASNTQNNEEVIPKREVIKFDKIEDIKKKIESDDNVPLESKKTNFSRSDSVHIESNNHSARPHKRKRLAYEDEYNNYRDRQRCVLCRETNHDERACENIPYPDNDEVSYLVI